MLGITILALISTSVYLLFGPLPRISPEPFQKLKDIKWRSVRPKTHGLSNSNFLALLWILHTDLLAGLTLHSSISRAIQRMPTHLFILTRNALAQQREIIDSLHEDALELKNPIFFDLVQILKVTNFTGSSAHNAIMRLIDRVQNEHRNVHLVASELAGTKATVLVLTCLPALGMLMSAGLGINSMKWLLGNPAGWACLLLGSSLEILGLFWVKLLINRATDVAR